MSSLKEHIFQLNFRDKHSNGLIENYQQIPQIWNPQMMQPPFQAMSHPTVQVLTPHLPASQSSTRDSSPSGSDYSSPLQSPSLRKKTVTAKETDSSSEENEKGRFLAGLWSIVIKIWLILTRIDMILWMEINKQCF